MRLYANEKRTEVLKIKVKPSVLKKAVEAWFSCFPNSEEPNFDDMFQEMIIEVAKAKNLLSVEDLPQEFVNKPLTQPANFNIPQVIPNNESDDILRDNDYLLASNLIKG